jgi:hypothetical protein
VGFERTIAVLERAKTVRALHRSATAIGGADFYFMSVPLREYSEDTNKYAIVVSSPDVSATT